MQLSERERRELAQLEYQLTCEDPDLAMRFTKLTATPAARRPKRIRRILDVRRWRRR